LFEELEVKGSAGAEVKKIDEMDRKRQLSLLSKIDTSCGWVPNSICIFICSQGEEHTLRLFLKVRATRQRQDQEGKLQDRSFRVALYSSHV
jgi:hypothetical protein